LIQTNTIKVRLLGFNKKLYFSGEDKSKWHFAKFLEYY